jgi:hypothetical protein
MEWPVLEDEPKRHFNVQSSAGVTLRMVDVPDEIILAMLERSPLKHSLLQEALASEPPIARPPLSLRSGHIALALAGGLCDQVVESDSGKFLVKGTLTSSVRKKKTVEKFNAEGAKIAEVDYMRTHYDLQVRCLREEGTVETYSSAEPELEEVAVDGEREEE